MARKRRLQGKWKQIGCSIVSVGILSCGAGYRTRHPGYLPFTGPSEVRIEQPRQRSKVFVLEPLTIPKPELLDQGEETEPANIKTNTVSPLKEKHISTSSRPSLTPPHFAPPAPEEVPRQKTPEELGREFLPNGFGDDLFNEPLLDNKASLRLFLDLFQTNQMPQSAKVPYQVVPPPANEPATNDAGTSDDKTSTTP